MKLAKPLLISAAVVILIVAIAVGYLLQNLDSIIKGVVEDVGTRVTGTRVTLDSVALDLGSGSGTLSGLTIANPAGYSSDYAFSLDKVILAVQPASLTRPVVVITEISIEGARLIAEQRGAQTNLSQILENVQAAGSAPDTEPVGEEPTGDPADVRLVVNKFVFADTRATVISELKGEGSLKVPDVRRSGIGDPATGLTPTELAERLMTAVIEELQAAVADYLAGLAKEAAKQKLQDKIGLDEKTTDAAESGLRGLLKRD